MIRINFIDQIGRVERLDCSFTLRTHKSKREDDNGIESLSLAEWVVSSVKLITTTSDELFFHISPRHCFDWLLC